MGLVTLRGEGKPPSPPPCAPLAAGCLRALAAAGLSPSPGPQLPSPPCPQPGKPRRQRPGQGAGLLGVRARSRAAGEMLAHSELGLAGQGQRGCAQRRL